MNHSVNNSPSAKRSIKERRKQVLTVLAHMLHSEKGMERITTARLAQEIGVSEAALYRYYPSKTKMFEALIDLIEENLLHRIKQSIKNDTDTVTRIHNIMQMILDFARKNPGMTRVLSGHALMFEDPALKVRIVKFFDGLELQFNNILQMQRLRNGKAFEIDEKVIAAHLVTFCEGQFLRYVRTNFRRNNHSEFEQQWPLFASLLK
ncbi:nucleoid occlusion factor SlmA [Testudinibacter sp. TR-2022]|uniref:nucleoid occlusion factor SlmA n=1 Tax=Testudinibacter sp. TR-2022 TaxID=2585029 RepID=UPI001119E6E8|nr:nucleoid occlusion factor SlmA [Testudinibacter sp. TR-2022]TNH05314.1 nucleoid occlusion factor SlmA [Pasteurellaceae bacterium Phil31]TNH08215.1 nucleoid occlusion factor SlmA [Testudinibacter sp. TR-2022]TNH11301.1 nucleoid occlusion factor SlmA [Testudinibacter sp. TR-2022]TNH14326.1 nucleoid occlusion factor SlmA [Testudinibacter sp. TR-2022]TNH20461.1 nucleoid occlusion factor SlmA [Testudinibacter sp. TR-2022]